MNRIDLHMHSTCSDGTMTPSEIVDYAARRGMRIISITDHDTVAHVKEALLAAEERSVEMIPGIEVSAEYESRGTMHILGYFIDHTNEDMNKMLRRFREGRDERNPKIVSRLNELGLDIEYKDVLKEAAGQTVGRPHIAQVLVDKGYVRNSKEAFTKYLAKGSPAYFDRIRFYPDTIIDIIHKAGGLAFLAHPKQLAISDDTRLEELVRSLISFGLDGIEVYSSCHNKKERALYERIAEQYDLLISGGSDFHGVTKEHIELGYIGNGIEMKDRVVTKMKERLSRQG
mgnify:FL=1